MAFTTGKGRSKRGSRHLNMSPLHHLKRIASATMLNCLQPFSAEPGKGVNDQ